MTLSDVMKQSDVVYAACIEACEAYVEARRERAGRLRLLTLYNEHARLVARHEGLLRQADKIRKLEQGEA